MSPNNALEASCLFRHGAYYYLFVNWGSCCAGVNSTYHIRMGRSPNITGPFLDREGADLADNGGTLFLESTGKFTGPGHPAVFSENGTDWFSYHYYDANAWAPWYGAYGVACFDLQPLSWTADGWPAFTNDWSAVYRFRADARDESGQYDGLLRGGASCVADPVRRRVLNLSGTNQFVQLPPGVAYARTFAAMIKWNGGAPWQRIFDFGTDTSRYVMLTPRSGNGRLRCDLRADGVTQTLEAPGSLAPGVWSHVALTFDGQRALLERHRRRHQLDHDTLPSQRAGADQPPGAQQVRGRPRFQRANLQFPRARTGVVGGGTHRAAAVGVSAGDWRDLSPRREHRVLGHGV
jgi:hypothetical protein